MNFALSNTIERPDMAILLGIPVDNLDIKKAMNRIMKMVDQYKTDGRKRLVATANVDFIVNAHDKKDLKSPHGLLSILRKADMVTADGMPLVWLSRLLGHPLKERVTGADMVPALAEKAAAEGKSIYLFGGQGNSAKQTAEILKARHPKLRIAGYSAPFIDMEDDIENRIEIARINITEPDILLIALGNPKQEVWFDRYNKYIKAAVSMGIGGTFEFISGKTSRAPQWMQKAGVEWMYRMTQDPKRLIRRYAKGLFTFNRLIAPLVILNTVSKQVKKFSPGVSIPNLRAQKIYEQNIGKEKHSLAQKIEIDLSPVTALLADDVLDLLNLIEETKKFHQEVRIANLKWLPKTTLKAYHVYDLVVQKRKVKAIDASAYDLPLAA